MDTTGFHSAASVPEGARITHVYFVATGHYGVAVDGQKHDTITPALEAAISNARSARTQDGKPVNPKVTVDVRWSMTYPNGGGQDAVAERYTYHDADDAQLHLDRIAKCAPVGAR